MESEHGRRCGIPPEARACRECASSPQALAKYFVELESRSDSLSRSTSLSDFLPRRRRKVVRRYVQRAINLPIPKHSQPVLCNLTSQTRRNNLLRTDLRALIKTHKVAHIDFRVL